MPKITPIRPQSPPRHLSSSSKQFWRSIVAEYVLESHHLVLLKNCCEALDRASLAAAAVEHDGAFFTDRFGAIRPHPGLNEERQSKLLAARCLRELGLDIESPNTEQNRVNAIAPNNWRGRA